MLSESTGSIGDTVHDTSSLTGATSDAGGTVTYTAYSNATCTTGARAAGVKTVTAGVVPNSDGLVFNSAGDFYWQAVYSGDSNNNGATSSCESEHLVIGKNSPSIATQLSASSAAIGATVHDSSTLTGATADAGGTVTYTAYSNDTCSTGARDAGTVTVSRRRRADSNGLQFNSAGDVLLAGRVQRRRQQQGRNERVLGRAARDRQERSDDRDDAVRHDRGDRRLGARLFEPEGATSDAGGTATYTVYTNNTCTESPRDAGTVTVSGGDVPDSNGLTFDHAGDYFWQVVYSGDANNGPPRARATPRTTSIS